MTSYRLERIAPGKNRLVLYPLAPRYRISHPEQFAEFLEEIGFIAALPGKNTFQGLQPGDLFMRHLTFVGCSPSVGTNESPAAYNKYSIDLITTKEILTVIAGTRVKSPVCPACGRRAAGKYAADGIKIVENRVTWICPECEAATPVKQIDWRNKLGVATHYIKVNGVFEGEVVPADKFLEILAEHTGTGWSFCYC